MDLSLSQRKVLLAMNAYPQYNDRQIAEVLGMKRSTITINRHKLGQFGKMVVLPSYEFLHPSFIGLKYGDYGKMTPVDYQQRMKLMTKDMKVAETIFSVSSLFRGWSLFYVKESHPFFWQIERWNALFEGIDSSIVVEECFFAPQMLKAYRFLDTHLLLAKCLSLESLPPLAVQKRKHLLHRKEQQVLAAWCAQPDASNAELSTTTGISRSVVGTMKLRFLEQGVARLVHLPDWGKLGMTLGVLVHLQLYPEQPALVERWKKEPEVIFLLASSHQVLFFALFKDYQSYEHSELMLELQQQKHLTKEPVKILFSLSETAMTCSAGSCASRIFGSSLLATLLF